MIMSMIKMMIIQDDDHCGDYGCYDDDYDDCCDDYDYDYADDYDDDHCGDYASYYDDGHVG